MTAPATAAALLACAACAACGSPARGTPADAAAGPDASDATAPADAPLADAADPYAGATLQMLAVHDDVGHQMFQLGDYVYSVYYSGGALGSVAAFDTRTYALAATIAVGKGPTKLTTDGGNLLVVNEFAADDGDAYLSIVDPTTNRVTHSLGVSTHMEGSDPDNYPTTGFPFDATYMAGELYLDYPTNAVQGILTVDVGTWHEHAFVPSGSGPDNLVAAGGRIVIVDDHNVTSPADDVLRIAGTDGGVLKEFPLPGLYHDVRASADGKVFIARAPQDMTEGQIVVIDPAALTMSTIDVGAGPYGLAVVGTKLYAMCQYANEVDVIDTTTLAVETRVPLAGYTPAITNARGISASPGGDIYIESQGMISVLKRAASVTP